MQPVSAQNRVQTSGISSKCRIRVRSGLPESNPSKREGKGDELSMEQQAAGSEEGLQFVRFNHKTHQQQKAVGRLVLTLHMESPCV